MTSLFNPSAARLQSASAKFKIGPRSAPHLKDHRFRGMVVLPGTAAPVTPRTFLAQSANSDFHIAIVGISGPFQARQLLLDP